MTALPIIPSLDVFKYRLTGHSARGEPALVHHLLLERSKETLHGRIVPAQADLHAQLPRRLMLHTMPEAANLAWKSPLAY